MLLGVPDGCMIGEWLNRKNFEYFLQKCLTCWDVVFLEIFVKKMGLDFEYLFFISFPITQFFFVNVGASMSFIQLSFSHLEKEYMHNVQLLQIVLYLLLVMSL